MIGLSMIETFRPDLLPPQLLPVPTAPVAPPFAALLEFAAYIASGSGSDGAAAGTVTRISGEPAADEDDERPLPNADAQTSQAMAVQPLLDVRAPPGGASIAEPVPAPPVVGAAVPAAATEPVRLDMASAVAEPLRPQQSETVAGVPNAISRLLIGALHEAALPPAIDSAPQLASASGRQLAEQDIGGSGESDAVPQLSRGSVDHGFASLLPVENARSAPVADRSSATPDLAMLRDAVVSGTLRASAELETLAIEIGAAEVMMARSAFRISTEHLGVLGIGVAPRSDGMAVQIAASDAERAAYIAAAQPQLIDDMRTQGIRLSGSGEPGGAHHDPSGDRGRPQWQPIETVPPEPRPEMREVSSERRYRLA